jgi:hypothetical protein
MAFCEKCGNQCDPADAFCQFCGHPNTAADGRTAVSPATVAGAATPVTAPVAATPATAATPAIPAVPPYSPPILISTETNGLAVASMVLGILWIGGLGALLALIFGYISKGQIARSNGRQTGRGMAIAGIVLGWVGVAGLILWIILLASLDHAANTALQNYSSLTTTTFVGDTGNSGNTTTTDVSQRIAMTPAGGTVHTWTVSAQAAGGYTESVTILLGHVEHAKEGATNGQDVAGSACTFNSATDALIPIVITAANTTANFPATVGYSINPGGAVTDGESNLGVMFEGYYNDGAQCSNTSDAAITGSEADTKPQTSIAVDGFLILPSYYSPQSPGGITAQLANTTLSVSISQDASDDSGDSTLWTVTGVSGPGVVKGDGEWYFDLAGTTPPSGANGNNGNSGNTGSPEG